MTFDYTLPWKDLIADALDPELSKQAFWVDFIYALIKPLREEHQQFLNFINFVDEEIIYSGESASLSFKLNQKFNSTNIFIENNARAAIEFYLYDVNVGENSFVYPNNDTRNKFIYPANTFSADTVGFTVYVPQSLIFNEDEMRAFIDKFLHWGSTYTISTATASQIIQHQNNDAFNSQQLNQQLQQ